MAMLTTASEANSPRQTIKLPADSFSKDRAHDASATELHSGGNYYDG